MNEDEDQREVSDGDEDALDDDALAEWQHERTYYRDYYRDGHGGLD